MRPVVVAVDVAADPAASVVERLVLVQPHLPFFQFPEPALDEGLALGVAVAAATMRDPELGSFALKRRAVKAEPLSGDEAAVMGAVRRLGQDRCPGTRGCSWEARWGRPSALWAVSPALFVAAPATCPGVL